MQDNERLDLMLLIVMLWCQTWQHAFLYFLIFTLKEIMIMTALEFQYFSALYPKNVKNEKKNLCNRFIRKLNFLFWKYRWHIHNYITISIFLWNHTKLLVLYYFNTYAKLCRKQKQTFCYITEEFCNKLNANCVNLFYLFIFNDNIFLENREF